MAAPESAACTHDEEPTTPRAAAALLSLGPAADHQAATPAAARGFVATGFGTPGFTPLLELSPGATSPWQPTSTDQKRLVRAMQFWSPRPDATPARTPTAPAPAPAPSTTAPAPGAAPTMAGVLGPAAGFLLSPFRGAATTGPDGSPLFPTVAVTPQAPRLLPPPAAPPALPALRPLGLASSPERPPGHAATPVSTDPVAAHYPAASGDGTAAVFEGCTRLAAQPHLYAFTVSPEAAHTAVKCQYALSSYPMGPAAKFSVVDGEMFEPVSAKNGAARVILENNVVLLPCSVPPTFNPMAYGMQMSGSLVLLRVARETETAYVGLGVFVGDSLLADDTGLWGSAGGLLAPVHVITTSFGHSLETHLGPRLRSPDLPSGVHVAVAVQMEPPAPMAHLPPECALLVSDLPASLAPQRVPDHGAAPVTMLLHAYHVLAHAFVDLVTALAQKRYTAIKHEETRRQQLGVILARLRDGDAARADLGPSLFTKNRWNKRKALKPRDLFEAAAKRLRSAA